MTLKQREKRLSPQCREVWGYLRQGNEMWPSRGLVWCGTFKLSTRIGEIERALGITFEKGWLKTGHSRVRTYRYRGRVK